MFTAGCNQEIQGFITASKSMIFSSIYNIFAAIWNFISCFFRKSVRKIIAYQTIRYEVSTLTPISRLRLSQVKKKILVLDLDETLIHSRHDSGGLLRTAVKPDIPPDFVLKVVIDRHPVKFFVHKRPHVDFFLNVSCNVALTAILSRSLAVIKEVQVSQWYELVVFTASMEIYGSAVCDRLDKNRGAIKKRFYRQHCKVDSGSFTKDLSFVHKDLSSIIILDNSPGAYKGFPENAVPIKSWFDDPFDTALLNVLPMLDALREQFKESKPKVVKCCHPANRCFSRYEYVVLLGLCFGVICFLTFLLFRMLLVCVCHSTCNVSF